MTSDHTQGGSLLEDLFSGGFALECLLHGLDFKDLVSLEATQRSIINEAVSKHGPWVAAASRRFPSIVLPPVLLFAPLAELKELLAALQHISVTDGKFFALKDLDAVRSLVTCIQAARKRSKGYNKAGIYSQVMLGAFSWHHCASDTDPTGMECIDDGPLFFDDESDVEEDLEEYDPAGSDNDLGCNEPMHCLSNLRFDISDEMSFAFCGLQLSCSMGWHNGPRTLMVDIMSAPAGQPKCVVEVDAKIVTKPECTIPSMGIGGFIPESLLCVFLVCGHFDRRPSRSSCSIHSLNLEPVRSAGHDERKNLTTTVLLHSPA
jgi:hypothetical protein